MRHESLSLGALLLSLACASAPGAPASGAPSEAAGPRGDAKTLTSADFANATQLTLADYIVAERPQWLRTPDGRPASVVVYVNDTRIGGPATLRDLTLSTIATVRYYEASAAQQRFSTRDRGPVIQVITK